MAGTSKSSIFRAIKSGRLSASRNEAGEHQIDPAEVARVYARKPGAGPSAERAGGPSVEHHEAAEWKARSAALEAELRAMRELVDELRRTRDAWQAQAER